MNKPKAVFDAYSRYYDLLYMDKDYAAETEYIVKLLLKYNLIDGDLLELGSGTGRHASLLVDRGYSVHGIERSKEMLQRTEKKKGFSCELGDICKIEKGRTYDAVLSLFHVVSYLTSNEQLNDVFQRTAKHLDRGGVFIFDVWYTPAVYVQQPTVKIKRMADKEFSITRIAEPKVYENENRVDVHYSIFCQHLKSGITELLEETHSMRHFSLPEIDLLSSIHGFKRISAEEFLTAASPSEETWGVCVTLQKI